MLNIAVVLCLLPMAVSGAPVFDGVCLRPDEQGCVGALPEQGKRHLMQVTRRSHEEGHGKPTLMSNTKRAGINPSGAAAPLDENGYAAVADCCCQAEMEAFISRTAFDLNIELCQEGGMDGIAPFFTCEHGPQTFAKLTADLLATSTDRCSGWAAAGSCPSEVPADCPDLTSSAGAHPDCMCSGSKAAKLDFTKAYLTQNNLGGLGPDSGTQEQRYVNIFGMYFPVRWSANTNLCIDVVGGSTANGANVATYNCVDDGQHKNMQWTLPASGTGLVRWTVNPGKCWTVDGNSPVNGANIKMWDCDPSKPEQQFITPASGSGLIQWATHPEMCIDVQAGQQGANKGGDLGRINIQLYTCDASNSNMQWTLPLVSEATDLVITPLTPYQSNSPTPNKEVPDNMKNGFGSLQVRWGTSTDFKFEFVQSGTSTPRVLEEVHLAFFDLDGNTADGTQGEFLSGKGYKGYITDAATSLHASTLPGGGTEFAGTKSVPNPDSPGVATDEQRKASVMFFMKDSSSLQVTFGWRGPKAEYTNPGENALLMFSGSSVLVDRCAA